MSRLIAPVRKFAAGEEGATMVEYGLMIALIALVCIVAISTIGTKTSTMYSSVCALEVWSPGRIQKVMARAR